jgi:hypothetical protein
MSNEKYTILVEIDNSNQLIKLLDAEIDKLRAQLQLADAQRERHLLKRDAARRQLKLLEEA